MYALTGGRYCLTRIKQFSCFDRFSSTMIPTPIETQWRRTCTHILLEAHRQTDTITQRPLSNLKKMKQLLLPGIIFYIKFLFKNSYTKITPFWKVNIWARRNMFITISTVHLSSCSTHCLPNATKWQLISRLICTVKLHNLLQWGIFWKFSCSNQVSVLKKHKSFKWIDK